MALRLHGWVFGVGIVVFALISTTILHKTMLFTQAFLAQSAVFKDLGTLDLSSSIQNGNIPTSALFDLQSPERIAQLQEFALTMFTELVPILVIAIVLVSLVAYIAMKYYLIAAIKQERSSRAVFAGILKYILPEIFLSMWVFLRSYTWVPLLGPIFALIFTPRFTLAGVYLVRDHQGIFTSAQRSFERTRGHWWYIVRSVYATCLVAAIAYAVARTVLLLLPLNMYPQIVSSTIVAQIALAFCTVSMVKIAETLMEPTSYPGAPEHQVPSSPQPEPSK